MKKIILIFLLITSITTNLFAYDKYAAVDAADIFFRNMRDNKVCLLWDTLSKKSRSVISDDIIKAVEDKKLTTDNVFNDFSSCGNLARSYWDGFLSEFDPNTVVNDAAWSIQSESRDEIEISLLYKTSKKPAILHMYFEDNSWKVGLVESFWLRKFFD